MEGLESLNESIKQAHEKLKTTYAEMDNKGNIAQMDGDTIKHSVKMALKESKNEESKSNNIIMYNYPEPNIKNKDERMEQFFNIRCQKRQYEDYQCIPTWKI